MTIIQPANRLDIKRCFVMTPLMRKFRIAGRYDTKPPTQARYLVALRRAKRAVRAMTEKQLDRYIDYPKRLRAYTTARWFIATLEPKELGTWKGAGGLPISWTRGSLAVTARKVAAGLRSDSADIQKRAKRAIPAILQLKSIITKEKLLFPIVFQTGSGTQGRRGLPKMRGDIDDGNMRAIALTLGGAKRLSVYFGLPSAKK